MNAPLLNRELVIDSFAGGGGASEGIKQALGRDPDIALNHDRFALAMHRVNHPGTRHMCQDVVTTDAVGLCAGQPIGMLWMSPDCTDHSKAKGAAPKRGEDSTRGLAWAIVGWVKALPKWQRPRVIFLENVEEFEDWGPLLATGKRCPVRKGAIFEQFVAAWRGLGYGNIEWRQRRAWKSGAGTIRKRLYMIMRRDGEPIVWPEPDFGDPNDAADAARIERGELQRWVTAADSIDFTLPCPSIFDSAEEIKRRFGIRAKRPLAENTMARIAKGTMRYVVNAARLFLVQTNHGGGDGGRDHPLDEPAPTMTAGRGEALVMPFVAYGQQGGAIRDVLDPLHTVTASRKDTDAVITPFVTKFNRGATGHRADEPLHTITAAASETHGGGAAPLGIAAIHLSRQFGASVGSAADDPIHTITAGGDGKTALVSAFLAQHNDKPRPCAGARSADVPISTITTVGTQQGVVAMWLAQHNTDMVGHDLRKPISTITTGGQGGVSQQGVVAAHMLNLRGTNRRGGSVDEPAPTITSGGNHAGAVFAFLAKYYGAGLPSAPVDEPLHTDTAKPRHGLVTVTIGGEPYVIVDIGMRMLTPRERFNAQGFRRSYIIDHGIDDDGSILKFTLEQQGYMCGNSVCPTEARALVAANYRPREVSRPRGRRVAVPPLFATIEAAE